MYDGTFPQIELPADFVTSLLIPVLCIVQDLRLGADQILYKGSIRKFFHEVTTDVIISVKDADILSLYKIQSFDHHIRMLQAP